MTVDCDKQALNNARQNLFSDLETNCIDGTVQPSDTSNLLEPKSEPKDVIDSAADVGICSEEQTKSNVTSTDNVQSIIVKLPLVMRLRCIKSEIPEVHVKTEVVHVKTEVVDADGDSPADVKPVESTTDDAVTTEEAETDAKKEATEAAKGFQLARETIASIFGTDIQPCTMKKIPIKRRAERDSDKLNDVKYSQTSQNDDTYNHSSKKRKIQHWYVLKSLHIDGSTIQFGVPVCRTLRFLMKNSS